MLETFWQDVRRAPGCTAPGARVAAVRPRDLGTRTSQSENLAQLVVNGVQFGRLQFANLADDHVLFDCSENARHGRRESKPASRQPFSL